MTTDAFNVGSGVLQILSCNTDANKISNLWHVWCLLAHKHVIYFLFRKPGGGGVGLGGLNQIKQPHVADFFCVPLV